MKIQIFDINHVFLVYEANIKPETSKPNPNSDRNQKETFIKEKYVHKTFISSTTVEVIFYYFFVFLCLCFRIIHKR